MERGLIWLFLYLVGMIPPHSLLVCRPAGPVDIVATPSQLISRTRKLATWLESELRDSGGFRMEESGIGSFNTSGSVDLSLEVHGSLSKEEVYSPDQDGGDFQR